jgi:uncharacterized membrane protein YkvA (DUF1232 family)
MDVAPDVMPVVGWIDDGIVASLLVTEVSQVALETLKQRKRSLAARKTVAMDDLTIS